MMPSLVSSAGPAATQSETLVTPDSRPGSADSQGPGCSPVAEPRSSDAQMTRLWEIGA